MITEEKDREIRKMAGPAKEIENYENRTEKLLCARHASNFP